jgi:hypothetical protein
MGRNKERYDDISPKLSSDGKRFSDHLKEGQPSHQDRDQGLSSNIHNNRAHVDINDAIRARAETNQEPPENAEVPIEAESDNTAPEEAVAFPLMNAFTLSTIKNENPEAFPLMDAFTLSTIKNENPNAGDGTALTQDIAVVEAAELIAQTEGLGLASQPSGEAAAIVAHQTTRTQVRESLEGRDAIKDAKADDREAIQLETDISELEDMSENLLDAQLEDIDVADQQDNRALLSRLGQNSAAFNSAPMNTASSTSNAQPLMGLSVAGLDASTAPQMISPSQPVQATAPTIANAVTNTVAEALVKAKETPKGVVVQLDPPEMGRVYIDFLFEQDNTVSVIIKSESAESQAILRDRQDFFHHLLTESGFEGVNISFENEGNSSEQSQLDDPNNFENRSVQAQSAAALAPLNTPNTPAYRRGEQYAQIDIRL